MNIYLKIMVISLFWKFSWSISDDEANCEVDEIADWGIPKTLDNINQKSGISVTWSFHDKLELTNLNCSPNKDGLPTEIVINVNQDTNKILIKNKTDFALLDTYDVQATSPIVADCSVTFTCKRPLDQPLTIAYRISDTNDFHPEFLQASGYKIVAPMPLLPRVDLNAFLDKPIQARDKDFSNSGMTFEIIGSSDFVVTSVKNTGVKTYQPVISVNKKIRFNQAKTFTLRATDSGSPPLYSDMEFTIDIDENESDAALPEFSKPYYHVTYKIDKNGPHLEFEEDIGVTSDSEDNDIHVTLKGDDSKYFVATYNADTKKVDLKINENQPIPDSVLNKYQTLYVTLSGTVGKYTQSEDTALIIDLPSKGEVPKFSAPFFTFEFTEKGQLTTDTEISVDSEDASVDFSPDDKYFLYFGIGQDPNDKKIWKLKATNADALKKLSVPQVTLALEASKPGMDKIGTATAIVNMPIDQIFPRFDKPKYSANYTGDIDVVFLDGDITVKNLNPESVDVTIYGEYADNFILTTKDHITYSMSIKKLPTNGADNPLSIAIQGKLNGAIAYATVSLQLLEKEGPIFSNQYYLGEYDVEKKSFNLKEPIKFTNEHDEDVKDVILKGDDANLFDINQNPDTKSQWDITTKSDVEFKKNQYILTIEATYNEIRSQSLVVVAVIGNDGKEVPQFSSIHYTSTFDKDNIVLEFAEGPITLLNDGAANSIVTIVEQEDEFSITRNTNDPTQWVLKLEKNPSSKKKFILTLRGELDGEHSESSVLVTMVEKEIPSFTQPHYSATYNLDNKVISIDHPIQLSNEHVKDTEVTLTEDTKDVTIVRNNKDPSIWDISVPTVPKDSNILLTLKASLQDQIAESTLVVTFKGDKDISPEFSRRYYSGVYKVNSNPPAVTIEKGPISVGPDPEYIEVTIVDSKYKEYFNAKRNGEDWVIDVVTAIPSEIVDTITDIPLELKAVRKGSTSTTVPVIISINLPHFNSPSYTAIYTVSAKDEDTVKLDNGYISISSSQAISKPDLSGDHSEFFQIEKIKDNDYDLKLTKNLEEKVLAENQIVLTVTAKSEEGTSTAGLVVTISKPAVQFDSSYYQAEYTVSQEGDANPLVVKNQIELQGECKDAKVKVSTFSKSFGATNKDCEITLNVLERLDNETLNQAFIVLTLETWIERIPTKSVTSVVVKLPASGSGNNTDDDDTKNKAGLLAAIGVLAFIVIACCVAIGLLYFLKKRKISKYSEMDDDSISSNDVRFSKHAKLSTSNGRKNSNIATRRPTGFIRYPDALKKQDDKEAEKEEMESKDTAVEIEEPKERRKSVAFDDNVLKLQIAPNDHADANETSEETTQL